MLYVVYCIFNTGTQLLKQSYFYNKYMYTDKICGWIRIVSNSFEHFTLPTSCETYFTWGSFAVRTCHSGPHNYCVLFKTDNKNAVMDPWDCVTLALTHWGRDKIAAILAEDSFK